MRICIPSIGSKVLLSQDWEFTLHPEYRNETMFKHLGLHWPDNWHEQKKVQPRKVTIPAGTELRVDRIYIRKGSSEYDSVTFLLCGQKTRKEVKNRAVRFWAKLADVNNIEVLGQVLD